MSWLARLTCALVFVSLASAPASAKPPWMSVEYPANPLHEDSRGALLLVHTYRHEMPLTATLVGYAEGIVAGQRVRREVTVTPTYRDGVYAVRGNLDGGTAWVVVLTMTDPQTQLSESMLVALNGDRALTAVDLPYAGVHDWDRPRIATTQQIDRFLQASIALAAAQPSVGRVAADESPASATALAGLLLFPLVLLGMRRTRWRVLAIVALLAVAAPASAGPPWIAVEYPANPLHEDSRGALLLVHTFHHGASRAFPLQGYAEGIVDGRRVRRELTITSTYRPGVHAVRGELDGGSAWVLVLTMTDTDTQVMESMLVALNGDGALTAVDIPYATSNEWSEPRAASAEQIDRFLEASVALAAAEPGVARVRAAIGGGGSDVPATAVLVGLLLVPAAAFGALQVRRGRKAAAG